MSEDKPVVNKEAEKLHRSNVFLDTSLRWSFVLKSDIIFALTKKPDQER